MNISTNYMYKQYTKFIMNSTSHFNDVAVRLSENSGVLHLSDDPTAAMNAVIYRNKLAKLHYYGTMREHVTISLTRETEILQMINNTLSAINTKIISIHKPSGNLMAIVQELKGLRDELLAASNTQDDKGNYIFSGYKTDIKPFRTKKGEDDIVYQGGSTPIVQQIEENREINAGHIGSDIFNIDSKNTIFKKLDILINELKKNLNNDDHNKQEESWPDEKLKAAILTARSAVRKVEDNVNNAQVTSGFNLKLLENLHIDEVGQREKITERLQQELKQDTSSQIALMTELQLSKLAIYSSIMVFQMLQSISLFSVTK